MSLIRLTMQCEDGAKIVMYAEEESEIPSVEELTKAKVISRRGSNETEMKMEQMLALTGTTQQMLADNDPLGGPSL